MSSKFLGIAVLAAIAASSFAQNNLTGNMTWVSGTLATQLTISSSPQTIAIKVGTVTDTFTFTLVTGAVGTVLPVGTPIEFAEKGSIPFAGSYTGSLNGAISDPADGLTSNLARPVPLLSTGALSDNVATVNQAGSKLIFYLPPCTAGGVSFSNGTIVSFGVPLVSYTVPIPGGGSLTSTVNFPAGSGPLNSFNWNFVGDQPLTIGGSGIGTAVQVISHIVSSPSVISSATLTITSGVAS